MQLVLPTLVLLTCRGVAGWTDGPTYEAVLSGDDPFVASGLGSTRTIKNRVNMANDGASPGAGVPEYNFFPGFLPPTGHPKTNVTTGQLSLTG